MGLVIGLAYNLKSDCPLDTHSPVDVAAECESEQTVARIAAALESAGHQVVPLPYNSQFPIRLQEQRPDLVFNIAEGWSGRNRESLVPAILEFYGIPYTGSDPLTLGIALDKALCKQVLAPAGVPTAPWVEVKQIGDQRLSDLEYPLFVKPNAEGSSIGIRNRSRVNNLDELAEKVSWILKEYNQPALVEEFLSGREFTVGILGNKSPKALPIIEVLPGEACPQGDTFVYSFETKSGNLERFACPAPLEPLLFSQITQIALKAYEVLGCRDVSRVDIRLDKWGLPNFIEINPLPGLSEVSLLPLQAQAAGLSFNELVNSIVLAAVERYPHLQDKLYHKEAALG